MQCSTFTAPPQLPGSDPTAIAGWNAPLPVVPSPDLGEGPPGSSFHYNYVDGAILLGDFDGVRGAVSLHVSGPWIGVGRLDYLTEDEGNTDVDLILLSGGAGYVYTVQDDLDFIGSAEIEFGNAEIDTPGGDDDDDDIGVRFRGGLRFQANEQIELAGGVSLATIFDEDVGLDARALYAFNEKISGFVGFEIWDDSFAMIGVRFGF